MDPKLDSGYLAPGESLESEYDVLRPLSAEECIGVMDQLLCQEVCDHASMAYSGLNLTPSTGSLAFRKLVVADDHDVVIRRQTAQPSSDNLARHTIC